MKNDWLKKVRQRLQQEADQSSHIAIERLRAEGMIDERGEVTGQLHRWDAYLGVVGVKRSSTRKQIQSFRCFMPVFGFAGDTLIDVSRESMMDYLKAGKKIVTATHDDRLDLWTERSRIQLSESGAIVTDAVASINDDVGDLPEFSQTTSRL